MYVDVPDIFPPTTEGFPIGAAHKNPLLGATVSANEAVSAAPATDAVAANLDTEEVCANEAEVTELVMKYEAVLAVSAKVAVPNIEPVTPHVFCIGPANGHCGVYITFLLSAVT